MAANGQELMRVYRTVRASLVSRGVRCAIAETAATESVKLYKRCVYRRCADALGIVTNDARMTHLAEIYKGI